MLMRLANLCEFAARMIHALVLVMRSVHPCEYGDGKSPTLIRSLRSHDLIVRTVHSSYDPCVRAILMFVPSKCDQICAYHLVMQENVLNSDILFCNFRGYI